MPFFRIPKVILTDENIKNLNPNYKNESTTRSKEDLDALIEGLKEWNSDMYLNRSCTS